MRYQGGTSGGSQTERDRGYGDGLMGSRGDPENIDFMTDMLIQAYQKPESRKGIKQGFMQAFKTDPNIQTNWRDELAGLAGTALGIATPQPLGLMANIGLLAHGLKTGTPTSLSGKFKRESAAERHTKDFFQEAGMTEEEITELFTAEMLEYDKPGDRDYDKAINQAIENMAYGNWQNAWKDEWNI